MVLRPEEDSDYFFDDFVDEIGVDHPAQELEVKLIPVHLGRDIPQQPYF